MSKPAFEVTTEVARRDEGGILSEAISVAVPSGKPTTELLSVMKGLGEIDPSAGGTLKGHLFAEEELGAQYVDVAQSVKGEIQHSTTQINPDVTFNLLPRPHNGIGGQITLRQPGGVLEPEQIQQFAATIHDRGMRSLDAAQPEGWVQQLRQTEKSPGAVDSKGSNLVSRITSPKHR